MKYLKPYKIFESNQSDVDTYLSKIGATRKDITDVFNGIIDLGYEPNFKLIYVDKEGNSKKEKSTAQETPIVLINFKSDKSGYVGGSIRFNNLDYIENLYHSLATLMSMYGDECKIEYELDNLIELKLRLILSSNIVCINIARWQYDFYFTFNQRSPSKHVSRSPSTHGDQIVSMAMKYLFINYK